MYAHSTLSATLQGADKFGENQHTNFGCTSDVPDDSNNSAKSSADANTSPLVEPIPPRSLIPPLPFFFPLPFGAASPPSSSSSSSVTPKSASLISPSLSHSAFSSSLS